MTEDELKPETESTRQAVFEYLLRDEREKGCICKAALVDESLGDGIGRLVLAHEEYCPRLRALRDYN